MQENAENQSKVVELWQKAFRSMWLAGSDCESTYLRLGIDAVMLATGRMMKSRRKNAIKSLNDILVGRAYVPQHLRFHQTEAEFVARSCTSNLPQAFHRCRSDGCCCPGRRWYRTNIIMAGIDIGLAKTAVARKPAKKK